MSVDVVRPLSAQDLSILALENQTVAGHTCKVMILDRPVDVARLRASVQARVDHAPDLRLRLSAVDGRQCWVSDPEFDVAEHVLPWDGGAPLDRGGLSMAVARLFEQRLDRSRPLWRMDVVPELDGGEGAIIWRIHHALADGATIMRIAGAAVWDEAPAVQGDHPEPRPHPLPPPHGPARTGGEPRAALAARARHREHLRVLAREAPKPWGSSPFDGRLTPSRCVAFSRVELDGLHRVAAEHEATLNDAVLEIVAGGLRCWLEARHGRLGDIRVKVPVSLHGTTGGSADREAAAGNHDSFFCLDLPIGASDPIQRLEAIRRATRSRKQGHDAEQLDSLMRDLGRASPRLRQFGERVLTHPRSFALNVSNVRGPGRPVQVLGSSVRALHSIAEIRERHALRIAVVSLANTLFFGLCADPTILPDVDHLARCLDAEADVLLASRSAG